MKGISLSALSEVSGVSKAMLNQVELGRSTPSINVLGRIARAFGVPFSMLITDSRERGSVVMRASESKVLTSGNGSFRSRALSPPGASHAVEFYELHLAAHSIERAEPHPALGKKENLVVADGCLTVVVEGHREVLNVGDAMFFAADSVHEYWNEGDKPVRGFLVISNDNIDRDSIAS